MATATRNIEANICAHPDANKSQICIDENALTNKGYIKSEGRCLRILLPSLFVSNDGNFTYLHPSITLLNAIVSCMYLRSRRLQYSKGTTSKGKV
ncbi:hypothetical protein MIMGU_mgv1a017081mg [Erythranthe guttata]|uniref:Uncharacterized protein n=1 Tax=Erythranthe guttata TaxID=4155 RepID=A0A022QT42_ERYGU|nr:hypothetical protein MIMGU_mgv1a017081mg [Erythranthe guttata]